MNLIDLYKQSFILFKKTFWTYILVFITFPLFFLVGFVLLGLLYFPINFFFGDGALLQNELISYSFFVLPFVVLFSPLTVGFIDIARRTDIGYKPEITSLLNGFAHFKGIILLSIIKNFHWLIILVISSKFKIDLIILLGGVVLIGIVVQFFTLFSKMLIAFNNYKIISSIEQSIKLVEMNFAFIFLSILSLIILNIIAVIPYGVGLLITIPFSACFLYLIYKKMVVKILNNDLNLEDNLLL